jgi:hypothetical protein
MVGRYHKKDKLMYELRKRVQSLQKKAYHVVSIQVDKRVRIPIKQLNLVFLWLVTKQTTRRSAKRALLL